MLHCRQTRPLCLLHVHRLVMSLLLEDFSVTWIPEKFKGRFLEFIQPARRNEAVLRNDSLSLRDLLVQ